MREFNTSGPNNPVKHYTLFRQDILNKGINLVEREKYFTICAPRQTGKSTYFRLLAVELEKTGYKVAHINFENFGTEKTQTFITSLKRNINEFWDTDFQFDTIPELFEIIQSENEDKCILIIDEVEGINKEYFGEFLHSIRNAYHSKERHCLKSVILVGVSNITGIMQDNASPFNIADELNISYFSNAETMELLAQHETETGQLFVKKVKSKIYEITAGQPGLVNGFAFRLVDTNPDKKIIDYEDYLEVEQWYLTRKIDKNISNVLKVAKRYRSFVENLLFTNKPVRFSIDTPAIEALHTNGLIIWDDDNNVRFWVPIYKKRLLSAFYPFFNGEGEHIAKNMFADDYLTENDKIDFDKLINHYKQHIKLRSFRPFREKDENGKFISVPEAAMIYSFETFISVFLTSIKGKSYREAHIALGNTDLIINVKGLEYFIETKKYYDFTNFKEGKEQLAYYCNRAGINEGIYIVFIKNDIKSDRIKESTENIKSVEIKTYLIRYDEKKEFGKD
ncbi:MAG: ATP-binding protein [Bacteroidota bacterium]|nr:ATP-binding protein [Bacteroidota bacterium]